MGEHKHKTNPVSIMAYKAKKSEEGAKAPAPGFPPGMPPGQILMLTDKETWFRLAWITTLVF